MSMSAARCALLDTLRGAAVLQMCAYHAMYDWVFIFGRRADWFFSLGSYLWQQSIAWSFILLSGACLTYAKKPVQRGIRLLLLAGLLTLSTALLMPSQQILFGILHCLACCMLFTGALRKRLIRIPPLTGAASSFFLFAVFKALPIGGIGFFDDVLLPLHTGWYHIPAGFLIGLPSQSFRSADYFPLVPWFFLFLTGFYGAVALRKHTHILEQRREIPVFSWIGRHSLLIYLLHQPVLLLMVSVVASF